MTQTSKTYKLTAPMTARLVQIAAYAWSPCDGTRKALAVRGLIDHTDHLTDEGRAVLWGAEHAEALEMNEARTAAAAPKVKAKAITFPVVANGVRRNAETGIEILDDGTDGWAVKSFHADKGDMFAFHATLAAARTAAKAEVELMREEIAAAYDEAAAALIEGIQATAEDAGPLSNRAFWSTLSAASHSVKQGFLGAAARRLNAARNMLAGVGFIADKDAAAALDAAEQAVTVGTRISLASAPEAVIDGAPFIAAETNRVMVSYKTRVGGRWQYGTAYADSVTVL
jgi:hypothetical protein